MTKTGLELASMVEGTQPYEFISSMEETYEFIRLSECMNSYVTKRYEIICRSIDVAV